MSSASDLEARLGIASPARSRRGSEVLSGKQS